MAVVYTKGGTQTPVAGAFSVSIPVASGQIGYVYVKSATSTTTFDVKILDQNGNEVFYALNLTGLLGEWILVPISEGIITFSILNASANEAFTYSIREIQEL